MAKSKGPLSLLYPFLLAAFVLNCHCNEQHRKAHVVYMGDLPMGGGSVASTHHKMLVEALNWQVNYNTKIKKEGNIFIYLTQKPLNCNSYVENNEIPSLAKESLLHSYGRSFNGFVARLSDEEVARISDMEGVVSVFPNTKLQLHTTRSWDFPNPPWGPMT